MFKPVSSNLNITLLEEEVLRFWKSRRVFQKSDQQGQGKPEYVFYEGPPTANGKPGVHMYWRAPIRIFSCFIKPCAYHVSRRGGGYVWLAVELEVEKRLGFTHKRQIEQYGIENEEPAVSPLSNTSRIGKRTERIAYWVD
jgi:isoleucyl-tRNA synthetase